MNCAPLNLQLVALFYALIIIFPLNVEVICASTNPQNYYVNIYLSFKSKDGKCYCRMHLLSSRYRLWWIQWLYYLNSLQDKLLYFQNKLNYLKSIWKSIKSLISLTELPNIASCTIIYNGQSSTKSQETANAFNNFFVNVTSDIQSFIKCSKNNFHDFLPPLYINFFSQLYW